jgi:hypothetical protein
MKLKVERRRRVLVEKVGIRLIRGLRGSLRTRKQKEKFQ